MRQTLLTLVATLVLAGAASAQVSMTGSGATFPYPIYSKWFDEYHKLHPQVQINYQSLGSGAGIQQLLAGTVDFGASDMPMRDEQLKQAKIPVMHFPTVLGAVVPIYNLPGVSQPLKFTPAALAGIFLGTITTRWNDPALASANPGVKLPAADIIVAHRSDGSGTTFVWTDYLSKVSNGWRTKVGSNTSVKWPVGLGGKGNEGVAALVKQTPDAIGYVELIYAVQNKLTYGLVQNQAGSFIKADLASVTEAAGAAANMPPDFRVSITNPSGRNAYPISSFTYLLVPSRWTDARKGTAMVEFLRWMATDGQKFTQGLSYAPLPANVVQRELEALKQIKVGS